MNHLFSDSSKQKDEDDKMLEKIKVRHSSISISENVVFICGSHSVNHTTNLCTVRVHGLYTQTQD